MCVELRELNGNRAIRVYSLDGGNVMAGQNVLNGDLNVLKQVISDVSEYSANREELDRQNDTLKELNKNIESIQKNINDEIDNKVKEGINSVSESFDQSILEEKVKLKDVQGKRDKAKHAGVKDRIQNETAELRDMNRDMYSQIKAAFKEEGIPKYCSKRWFYALFATQGIGDVLIYVISLVVLYAAIPGVIYIISLVVLYAAIPGVMYIIPQIPKWVLIVYYFVMITLELTAVKLIYNRTMVPHSETIAKARMVKYDIETNQKKIKRIEKGIRKDKNEDMYGLSDFDYRINEINDSIRNIEDAKAKAIEQFNATTRTDIIAEIRGRNAGTLEQLKSQVAVCEQEMARLDSLIKNQRAYISSNYEAYLGREFTNVDRLTELLDMMIEEPYLTISMAIAQYKARN